MRTKYRALIGILLTGGTWGCGYPRIHDENVVEMEICPDADELKCSAEPIADGHDTTVVRVCAAEVKEPASGLKAKLATSGGQFQTPSDPTKPTLTELELGNERCALATLVMPKDPGFIRVDATLAGFTVEDWVEAKPAAVDAMSLAASVQALSPDKPTGFDVTVHATSADGAPVSVGTRVEVTVAAVPSDLHVTATPKKGFLDDDGELEVSVYVPRGADSATLKVTVTSPKDSLGNGSTAITEELTLHVESEPDAGADSGD